MGDRRTAAFFDFDSTLLADESGRLGVKYIIDKGLMPTGLLLRIFIAHKLFKRGLISEKAMIGTLLRVYKKRTLAEFEAGADEFFETVLRPNLAPRLVEVARNHQRRGHVLVLISGSIRYMLRPVARELSFDHLICTDLEQGPDGLLTGKTQNGLCVGPTKREKALELAAREKIDLGASYAYGDHHDDLPLLNLVGHPHAVEPNEKLAREASQKGWPVLSHF